MIMKEMVNVEPTHLPHHSYIHATELAIQYMKEHLDEEVTSEQLAHLVGYSAYHFTRIFKKATGISPRQYLSALRIESGKQALLKQPSLLTKIMLSIGFRSAGSFHHRFKQFVGLSPKKFAATSSELFSHMNQYEHTPLTSDTLPSSPQMCIHCQLETPPDFRGLLFVGLFPRPIPDQKPIVGTALNMRNRECIFTDISPGTYYILAAGIPWSRNPVDYFKLDTCLRGKFDEPVEVNITTKLHVHLLLRDPLPYDPPIVVNLPLLLFEKFNRKRAN